MPRCAHADVEQLFHSATPFIYRSGRCNRLKGAGTPVSNAVALLFARLSNVSCSGLILFISLLLPSSLGSTAAPKRAVGWYNHAGGLAGHAARSRRCTESVRGHYHFYRSSLRLSPHEKILCKSRTRRVLELKSRVPYIY